VATSKLQIAAGDMLDKTFPQYRIRENYRPDWLMSSNITKLELDFYIEELKIGFEVQGAQHYQFVPHFHGTIENYEKRKQYDIEKRDLCYGAGVKLIEIFCLMDAIIEVKNIEESLPHYHKLLSTQYPSQIVQSNIIVLSRYAKDQNELRQYGDPDATYRQRIDEIRKFKNKTRKMRKNKKLLYFEFKYLSLGEQEILLDEARSYI